MGFFAKDALPWPLAGGARWVDTAFAAINGEQRPVDFDPPRTPPWRGDADTDDLDTSSAVAVGSARRELAHPVERAELDTDLGERRGTTCLAVDDAQRVLDDRAAARGDRHSS